jgi:3-deoxy-D-manno-octulosonic-acid transferase
MGPDHVLAISHEDVRRFSLLFGDDKAELMNNIKFDRFTPTRDNPATTHSVRGILPASPKFLIVGSVRQEEEPLIEKMLVRVRHRIPDVVIGLFPRHMHRIAYWKSSLNRLSLKWESRSGIRGPVQTGSIILWDTFGELAAAYHVAEAAFIGGSLAPLGGQNFLEPLTCGTATVIGPYWDNFYWVGHDIIEKGLVDVAPDWKAAADRLIHFIHSNTPREQIRQAAHRYIAEKQGGTLRACKLVADVLKERR